MEADELTYCLHVILRFEIEIELIDEVIKVTELPQVWYEKMNQMLGVTPKNDVEGVLQDMHWSGGNFGYFPTYAIGSIYSAQIYNKLVEERPQTLDEIIRADFKNIVSWLNVKIHQHGRKMMANQIIKNACGGGLNSKVFVNYLKNKYYDLYNI